MAIVVFLNFLTKNLTTMHKNIIIYSLYKFILPRQNIPQLCICQVKNASNFIETYREKNSTRFIEKKNPSNVHTFCHREEKTIEHNILGKSDRIQIEKLDSR